MQPNDARMFRGAVIPASVAGALCTAVAAVVAGGAGALGAVLGAVLTAAFFSAGMFALAWASRFGAQFLFGAAMAIYAGKMLLLGVALALAKQVTIFDHTVFALSVACCAVVWIIAQARVFGRLQMLYVEPREGS